MSDLEKFSELVDEIWEMVFGTVRRPEVKFKGMMTKEKPKQVRGEDRRKVDRGNDRRDKPKRARGLKGRYKGDDKSTAYTNEAWVGGKAPKKRKK